MTWTPVPVLHPAYVCFELDAWVRSRGFDTGPLYVELTYGGTHSATSAHYPANGARARDFWGDYHAIADWLVRYADGPGYMIEELFCSETGIAWSHGNPSGFHDAGGHTHAALRPGAKLPTTRRRDSMGCYPLETVAAGERKTFRLLPPGGGAIGPIDDPIFISIPFDEFGGGPAKWRWAITDDAGKVIDSNDATDKTVRSPGVRIVAHAGAYALSLENREPAGGRHTGQGLVEWQYKQPTAAMAAEAVQSDETASDPVLAAEPTHQPDPLDLGAPGDQSPSG